MKTNLRYKEMMIKSKVFNLSLIIAFLASCEKPDNILPPDEVSNETKIEFNTTVYDTQIPAKIGHEAIFFNNYFWIMGGGVQMTEIPQSLFPPTTNELWRSSDGITWKKIQEHTVWDGRKDFNLFTFQNKLWIIGGESGRDSNGNEYTATGEVLNRLGWKGDIWNSDDGINWVKITDYGPWQTRLGSAVGVFNNKLFLIGGHSTTNWNLYQDIYESADGKHWTKIGEIEEQTIGTSENRQGLYKHAIIEFDNKLFLLGGARASSFNVFNWILESKDGLIWTTATKEPYWKDEDSSIVLPYLRPFVFKNKLWVIMDNELLFSENGVHWEKHMDLPLFDNNISNLKNPKAIVKNNTIYIYGSYHNLSGFFGGTPDTQIHIIKLEAK